MTFREYMGDALETLNRLHITRCVYMMYLSSILMIIITTIVAYQFME